jgi:hypothetical protein
VTAKLEIALFKLVLNPVYRAVRFTPMGAWMSHVIYRTSLSEKNKVRENFWAELNSGHLGMTKS